MGECPSQRYMGRGRQEEGQQVSKPTGVAKALSASRPWPEGQRGSSRGRWSETGSGNSPRPGHRRPGRAGAVLQAGREAIRGYGAAACLPDALDARICPAAVGGRWGWQGRIKSKALSAASQRDLGRVPPEMPSLRAVNVGRGGEYIRGTHLG